MSDDAGKAVVFAVDVDAVTGQKALVALGAAIEKLASNAEAQGKKIDAALSKVGKGAGDAAGKAAESGGVLDAVLGRLRSNVVELGQSAVPSLGGLTNGLGGVVSAAGPAGIGLLAVTGGVVALKGAADAAIGAVSALVSAAMRLAALSAEDFAAQRSLAAALAQVGDQSERTREHLETQAVALSRATGASDDAVTRAQANFVRFGGLQGATLDRAVKDTVDWSVRTGRSVDEVVASFRMGMNGMGRSWRAFGIEVSREATPMQNLNSIMRGIERTSTDAAVGFAHTLPGAMAITDEEIVRLKRNIGDYIARSPSVIAGILGFARALGVVTDDMKAQRDVLHGLTLTFFDFAINVTTIAIRFRVSMDDMARSVKWFAAVISVAFPMIGADLLALKAAMDAATKETDTSDASSQRMIRQSAVLQALLSARLDVIDAYNKAKGLLAKPDAKGGPGGDDDPLGATAASADKAKTTIQQLAEQLKNVNAEWAVLRVAAPDALGLVAAATNDVVAKAAELYKKGIELPDDLREKVLGEIVSDWIPKTNAELSKDENKLKIQVGIYKAGPGGTPEYPFKMPTAKDLDKEFGATMSGALGAPDELQNVHAFDEIRKLADDWDAGIVPSFQQVTDAIDQMNIKLADVPDRARDAADAMAWQNTKTLVLKASVTALKNAVEQQGAAMIVAAIQGKEASGELFRSLMTQLAQEAWVKALFELAEAFACLFTAPPKAAAHFKSAALYGAVGTAAAMLGRGGSSGAASSGTSASASSGVSETRTDSTAQPFEQNVHIYIDGQGFVQDFDAFARKIAETTRKELVKAGRAQR